MTGIAYQYALAVFSLAKEVDKEEAFKEALSEFAKGMNEDQYKFFAHPKIDKNDKRKVIDDIVKDSLLKNFIKVLIDNDRISLIEAILVSYQEILDELNKVMNVKLFSNSKMTSSNLNKIKVKLKKTYNRTVEIEELIDEKIIGGYRIEFEGNVIDETINKQIDNIKSSLLE